MFDFWFAFVFLVFITWIGLVSLRVFKPSLLSPPHHHHRSSSSFRSLTNVLLFVLYLSGPVCLLVHHRAIVRAVLNRTVLNLDKGSRYYHQWADNATTPIQLKLTFFDVLNADELVPSWHHNQTTRSWFARSASAVPVMKVRETTAFTFHQYPHRHLGNYSHDKRTLFFHESAMYILDPATDEAELDRPLVVPNFPLIALLAQVERYNGVNNYMPILPLLGGTILDSYSVEGINQLLVKSNESLFINTTPRELIFGYQVKLAQFIDKLIDDFIGGGGGNRTKDENSRGKQGQKFMRWFRSDNATEEDDNSTSIATPTERKPRVGNFSLFNLLNGTRNGPFEIYTGLNGTSSVFSQIRSYQSVTRLSLWRQERCNVINGSDMAAWPYTDLTDVYRLKAFVHSACRSFDLEYEQTRLYKGVSVRKYIVSFNEFQSARSYAPNRCYCTRPDSCRWDGFLDLSPCYDGIPLFASKAYFLGADPDMSWHRVTFTTPLQETEDTHLLVHPLLGTSLHGRINLQMSLHLTNESKFMLLQSSLDGEYQVPFVHFWKAIHMDDETARTLRTMDLALKLVKLGCWVAIGCVLVWFCYVQRLYVLFFYLYSIVYYLFNFYK